METQAQTAPALGSAHSPSTGGLTGEVAHLAGAHGQVPYPTLTEAAADGVRQEAARTRQVAPAVLAASSRRGQRVKACPCHLSFWWFRASSLQVESCTGLCDGKELVCLIAVLKLCSLGMN